MPKERDTDPGARTGPGAAPGRHRATRGDAGALAPLRPALRLQRRVRRSLTAQGRRPARLGPRARRSAGPSRPALGLARPRLRALIPPSPPRFSLTVAISGSAALRPPLALWATGTVRFFSPRGRPFGGRPSVGGRRFGARSCFRWSLAPLIRLPSLASPTCRLSRYPSGTRALGAALALAASAIGAASGGALKTVALLMHPLATAPSPSLPPPTHRAGPGSASRPADGMNGPAHPRAVFADSVFLRQVQVLSPDPESKRAQVLPLRHRPRSARTTNGPPGLAPGNPNESGQEKAASNNLIRVQSGRPPGCFPPACALNSSLRQFGPADDVCPLTSRPGLRAAGPKCLRLVKQ